MDSYSKLYDRVNKHSAFAVHNHIKITHIDEDKVEGELTIAPESLNPLGFVHGGCLVSLADSVAGTAVYTKGRACVTLDCSFNYLRPATGTKIRCVARPQKIGHTIAVYEVLLTDDQERPVASGIFNFFRKEEAVGDLPCVTGAGEAGQVVCRR